MSRKHSIPVIFASAAAIVALALVPAASAREVLARDVTFGNGCQAHLEAQYDENAQKVWASTTERNNSCFEVGVYIHYKTLGDRDRVSPQYKGVGYIKQSISFVGGLVNTMHSGWHYNGGYESVESLYYRYN